MAMGYLRPEDFQYIRKNVLHAHLLELVGRKLIAADGNVPAGAQEAKRYRYTIPSEGAKYLPKGAPYPKAISTGLPTTVQIHKFGIGVDIDEWDMSSALLEGQFAVDKQMPIDLGRKVAEKEDAYILQGDTMTGETGLYGNAALTVGVGTQWATGNPYADMNTAVGKIEANGFNAKFAVFNVQDYALLRRTDTYGNVYRNQIIQNLGIPESALFKSGNITKGTALVGDAGADISELKIAEDINVLPAIVVGDTTTINVREKIGMDIYETGAYCTLTNIS